MRSEVGSYCCLSVEKPLPSSKTLALLGFLALPRLRKRSDEFGAPPALDNPLGGLAVLIKLAVLSWVVISRSPSPSPLRYRVTPWKRG